MKITLNIPDDQAFALGKLCKRLDYAELRVNARDDAEVKLMERAIWALQQALLVAGADVGR